MAQKRLLIVEDERIIAEDIKKTLLKFDYEVIDIISKGEDVLANFEKLNPDLILMDIMLAGEMTGIETASKLKEKYNVPIIYLTAFSNEPVLSDAKLTEPFGYLIKPFEDRELHATIEMAFYRYKIEHNLRLSEHKYRHLFNSIADPIFIFSKSNQKFITCNDVVHKFYGYSKDELSEMSLTNLHPQDEYRRITQQLNKPSEHPQLYHHYKRNQDILVVNIITNDIQFNGLPASLITVHDITDKTLAEENLRKTQFRLSTVFKNVPNIILYETGENRQFISENVNKLLGIDKGELVRNKQMIMKRIHRDDLEIITEKTRLWNVNQSKEMLTIWYRVSTQSGKLIWIEDRMIHVTTNKGERYITGVLVDNTAIKEAEAEKKKIREQLYQSQKMEVVGKLAGGIAHDFNNLLTAINGYSELALKKVNKDDNIYNDIKVINECGERAARLTKQLLGFSRKQIAEKENIDINKTIIELEKMLKRLIGDEIILETNLHSSTCIIFADKSQIEQVLVNLIVNARDAISGCGNIKISTSQEVLSKDTIKQQDIDVLCEYILISVLDTGYGMSKEIQKKIFEPFFTTKQVGKGTGLGLSTVFGIVQQNEGVIFVESEEGKGSEFKIYFPKIIADIKEEEIEEVKTHKLPTGHETILLVDDEDSIRDFLSDILKEQGYKVIEASNGLEALYIFQKIPEKINLLISDITMPKMSGPELAAELREIQPALRALFISGNLDNEFMREQEANPNIDFLQKPFTYDSIILKVRESLKKPKTEKEN